MQDPEVIRLLEQIRDLQNAQLEGQRELLKTQQAHTALYQSHLEQVQRINEKAEKEPGQGCRVDECCTQIGVYHPRCRHTFDWIPDMVVAWLGMNRPGRQKNFIIVLCLN